MSFTDLTQTDAVATYAAAAFAIVLDQHELPIPAPRVEVTHLYRDTYALYFASTQLEAQGLYQGSATGGTVTLGVVHRMNDRGQTLFKHDYQTVDRFDGVKVGPVFTPRLLTQPLVTS